MSRRIGCLMGALFLLLIVLVGTLSAARGRREPLLHRKQDSFVQFVSRTIAPGRSHAAVARRGGRMGTSISYRVLLLCDKTADAKESGDGEINFHFH